MTFVSVCVCVCLLTLSLFLIIFFRLSILLSTHAAILSKHYDENCEEPYFQQCFEICCKLGSGFFGDVFKVRSKEDGQFYAVKRSRERFKGRADRQQKLQEVAKHEHLPDHPNLVKFFKAWEEQQRLYIQTELCKCSLSTVADLKHDIPEQEVWNFLVDMLMAVQHLHAHNLVHLDIKPENIFISEDGLYKLGDFGLVIDLSRGKDVTDPIEGDPKYLAKELMQEIFTQAADIFSLGITTLELACDLDLPRGGDNWHKLRNGQIPEYSFKHISQELRSVIKDMMHPEYKQRPTASQLLKRPYIHKIRRKRVWRRKLRRMLRTSWSKAGQFFYFLCSVLFIFDLIGFLSNLFRSKEFDQVPMTPCQDRSLFFNDSLESRRISASFKDSYSDEEFPVSCNDRSFYQSDLLISADNITPPPKIQQSRPQQQPSDPKLIDNYQLQDSTVCSSVSNGNRSNELTPPPPCSFYQHLNRDQFQSTAQRGVTRRFHDSNDESLNRLNFSQLNNSPIPHRRASSLLQADDSPTSIYLSNSFNQSTTCKLSFTDVSDEEEEERKKGKNTPTKTPFFNSSFHSNYLNNTTGQKNLLKVSKSRYKEFFS